MHRSPAVGCQHKFIDSKIPRKIPTLLPARSVSRKPDDERSSAVDPFGELGRFGASGESAASGALGVLGAKERIRTQKELKPDYSVTIWIMILAGRGRVASSGGDIVPPASIYAPNRGK